MPAGPQRIFDLIGKFPGIEIVFGRDPDIVDFHLQAGVKGDTGDVVPDDAGELRPPGPDFAPRPYDADRRQ